MTQDGDFLLFEGNRYDRRGFLYKSFVMSAIVSQLLGTTQFTAPLLTSAVVLDFHFSLGQIPAILQIQSKSGSSQNSVRILDFGQIYKMSLNCIAFQSV